MGFSDIIGIGLLFLAFVTGYYIFFIDYDNQSFAYKQYELNLVNNISTTYGQFYPNLRFSSNVISYSISDECDNSRQESIKKAFNIIEDKTILTFLPSQSGSLMILCSDNPPEPENKKHYVAGEGGPTVIINASQYYVIKEAQLSLYREEKCDFPVIAVHELLHALGFDHINNKKSILYPISECNQNIDDEIIQTINELYSVQGRPDLTFASLNASKSGRYMNFEVFIDNYGLEDSLNSTLEIYGSGELIDTFILQELGYGKRKMFSVTNMIVPRDVEEFEFKIINLGEELSEANNIASIRLIEDKSNL